MTNTTTNLTNINLLTKAQYDAIQSPATDELWAVQCSVVVESYNDGNGNWYRIWSDGWIEQCQRIQLTTTLTEYNLLKPFNSNFYFLSSIPYSDTSVQNSWSFNQLIIAPKTASSFQGKQQSSSNYFTIYACGQGATE